LLTRRQALFSIHLVAVLFGATGIFGAVIEANAAVITWGRAAFAVLTLTLLGAALGERGFKQAFAQTRGWALLSSGGMLALHWVSFFVSVKLGGVAVATLGFASFPAFITLIEWAVLRERIQRAEWLRLFVVSLGLLLITPSFDLSDVGTEGLLWGLLSGASFGVLAVMNRRALSGVNAFHVAGLQNAVVCLLLTPWIFFELRDVSLTAWYLIAALGIVCTGIAHLLFVSSLRSLHARTAGLVVASEPLYAIAFAWMLFAEVPSPRTLVGAVMMVGAIFSASLAVHRAKH
jgi:drug/metabolite transporter (DMT)-like permease